MNVLIACESSGVEREAFRAMGHNAWSCDLLDTEIPGQHYKGDVRDVLGERWDLMVGHPPCTYLTVAGRHWDKNPNHWRGQNGNGEREKIAALAFVRLLMSQDHIPHVAIENPISIISTEIRKPDQIIQPYEYGEDASKKTCLWLKHLPKLIPTCYVPPRITSDGKKRWANQTDSGQNRLAPGPDRWRLRSKTYPGIARTMATQWSNPK